MTSANFKTKGQRLVFRGKQQVELEEFVLPTPKANEVVIRAGLTLMSTGTENIVFNRLFDPGTHWDDWVKYPFYPGYSFVGTVEVAGDVVSALKPGDRVAYRLGGHASRAVVPEALCYPIPGNVSFEDAVWFALAKITFVGAKAAEYRLGDQVLIIGAGPIGQMSIRWACAAGAASIGVVDMAENRMALAKAGGASMTIALPIGEAKEAILRKNNGRSPGVVIDSTGNAAVFSTALGLVADHGRVVILGDTGRPAQQFLTSDVIRRGLTIIGAHDGHNTPEWNDASVTELFMTLVASGRFPMTGMESHRFKPEQCGEAYTTANRDREQTMGIVFDWSDRA